MPRPPVGSSRLRMLILGCWLAMHATASAGTDLLIRFSPGVSESEAASILAGHGVAKRNRSDPSGWMRASVAGNPAEARERLRADRRIAASEPNFAVTATAVVDPQAHTWTPDDPWLRRQWNLAGMPAAWYASRGSAVTVAVLDTGLRSGAEGPAQTLAGFDFVNDDADPTDDNGHGTHIASIIAQSTDNGALAAGLAPEVSLLPIKVLDAAGQGTVHDVAQGIYFATDAGAHVINLSLALSPAVLWSTPLHDAVRYAAARGVVLVGAAGNDGALAVSLPAAFNEVIAVGAYHSGGAGAGYSNRGTALDLVAPGGDPADRDQDGHADGIAAWSFDPAHNESGLFLGAGTSQAAAHVSGVAALLIASGESDRDRIRTIIELSAAPVAGGGSGWNAATGYGRLDAPTALDARASLATRAPHTLGGWVSGQSGSGGSGSEIAHAVGLVLRHRGELMVVLHERGHLYALAEDASRQIVMYRLRGGSIQALLVARGGLMSRLEGAGSLRAYLESDGQRVGNLETPMGLLGLVDGSGSLIGMLDASGGVIAFLDASGTLRQALESAGGMLSLVESAGGMLSLIESAGSLMGLVGSAGGMAALVDGAGSLLGMVEGARARAVLGESGLLPLEL